MITAGGRYVSNWKIAEDGMLALNIEVPFNAKANVTFPRFYKEKLSVSGFDASIINDDGKVTLDVGTYEISYMPCHDYRCIYSENTRLSFIFLRSLRSSIRTLTVLPATLIENTIE